ncbi:MAG TPA: hypothetical protein VGI06_04790 [Acidimicrobiales bacterium]|jgi:hypothetical protein
MAVTRGTEGSDWTAARAGALADLAVFTPVVAAYEALHGAGALHGDAGTVTTALIAVFIAPLVGGITAGRRDPSSPLTSSAVASFGAVIVFVAVRIIDAVARNRPTTVSGTVILVMLSVVVGVIGGLIGARIRPGRLDA